MWGDRLCRCSDSASARQGRLSDTDRSPPLRSPFSEEWQLAEGPGWLETAAGLHGKLKAGVLQLRHALAPEHDTP